METLVPALIALIGVLVGLRSQKSWNQRAEKRDAYIKFVSRARELQSESTLSVRLLDEPADSKRRKHLRSESEIRDLMASVHEASSHVQILGGATVVEASRIVLLRTEDLEAIPKQPFHYFSAAARFDLSPTVFHRAFRWRKIRQIRSSDWYQIQSARVKERDSKIWKD